MHHRFRMLALMALAAIAAVPAPLAAQAQPDAWWPQPVESKTPPFNPQGVWTRVDYVPGDTATTFHRICAAMPDLDLGYFAAVAYGINAEARRQGVAVRMENAVSFDVERQREQIEGCIDAGVDALIVVAAAAEVIEPVIDRARAQNIVVIDLNTGSGSENVTAKILADSVNVGAAAGSYLVDRHPLGSDTAAAVWLPGPPDSDFARDYDTGFRQAIERGALTIAGGDFIPFNENVMRGRIGEILDDDGPFDIIAGTSISVPLAMDELAERRLTQHVAVVSTGINRMLVQGLETGRVYAAVNDKPVVQGRIAVDLAIRALEDRPFMVELRPSLQVVDGTKVAIFDRTTALIPPSD